jgi:hypothetical protein
MLRDALQGHFAERLADVVRSVCAGSDVAGAAMRALRVGHSSGADVLCGLLFGYSPVPAALPIHGCATARLVADRHAARASAIVC